MAVAEGWRASEEEAPSFIHEKWGLQKIEMQKWLLIIGLRKHRLHELFFARKDPTSSNA